MWKILPLRKYWDEFMNLMRARVINIKLSSDFFFWRKKAYSKLIPRENLGVKFYYKFKLTWPTTIFFYFNVVCMRGGERSLWVHEWHFLVFYIIKFNFSFHKTRTKLSTRTSKVKGNIYDKLLEGPQDVFGGKFI